MPDANLARLYEISTKTLVQTVKPSLDGLPSGLVFPLARAELQNLRSQFVTSSQRGRSAAFTVRCSKPGRVPVALVGLR